MYQSLSVISAPSVLPYLGMRYLLNCTSFVHSSYCWEWFGMTLNKDTFFPDSQFEIFTILHNSGPLCVWCAGSNRRSSLTPWLDWWEPMVELFQIFPLNLKLNVETNHECSQCGLWCQNNKTAAGLNSEIISLCSFLVRWSTIGSNTLSSSSSSLHTSSTSGVC